MIYGQLRPQPDMDVEAPVQPNDDGHHHDHLGDYRLPEDDRREAERNSQEGQLQLESLDQRQSQQGIIAFYNTKTGDFTAYDPVSGETVHGTFKSNTEGYFWHKTIASGDYAILERGQMAGKSYRLEAYDSRFGDDDVDASGQDELRLHLPADSVGCITAVDAESWSRVGGLIQNRPIGDVDVESLSGLNKFLPNSLRDTERVKFYGTLHVF
jgi:hypothetical protein